MKVAKGVGADAVVMRDMIEGAVMSGASAHRV